jgi:hypothetical protein
MGWTFTHREKGTSNLDWFRQEFCPSEPERLIDVATKNGTAYAAYRSDSDGVIAFVILTRWVRGDYYNFGYKDMDEGQGPSDDDCPARIFALLDPLPPEKADPSVETNWAAQWRQRVEERLNRPKVTKGMRVRFPSWRYRGGDYGVLTYLGGRGRNLFVTEYGQHVRFTAWRSGPYEVVA